MMAIAAPILAGHTDKCPEVVGQAAAWVIEIMNEEDLISTPEGDKRKDE